MPGPAGTLHLFLTSTIVAMVPQFGAVPEPATWGMMLLGFSA